MKIIIPPDDLTDAYLVGDRRAVWINSPGGHRFEESDDRKAWVDLPADGRVTRRYVRLKPPPTPERTPR